MEQHTDSDALVLLYGRFLFTVMLGAFTESILLLTKDSLFRVAALLLILEGNEKRRKG